MIAARAISTQRPRFNRALILRNHGLVTVGRTIAEVFLYLHRLETACKTQVDTLAMNSSLVHVSEEVCENSLRQIDEFSTHVGDIGALEFQAFIRTLDQTDAGYRELKEGKAFPYAPQDYFNLEAIVQTPTLKGPTVTFARPCQ